MHNLVDITCLLIVFMQNTDSHCALVMLVIEVFTRMASVSFFNKCLRPVVPAFARCPETFQNDLVA